jgi:hypothetical protein
MTTRGAQAVTRLLLLALVASAACGKSKSECKAEADGLTALLSQSDAGGSMFYIDESNGLVTRTDLSQRALSYSPVVIVKATETMYQGELVDDDGLRRRLEAAVTKIKEDIELGRGEPPDLRKVYFLIHSATPWSRVAAAVKVADDVGMQAPMFVFAHPMTAKAPPRTSVDSKLEAIKDGNKATTLANIMSGLIKKCPSLIRAIGEIANELDASKTKDQMFAEKVGPALVACDCNVDYPELRSVLWHLLVNQTPTRIVAIDPTAPKETIAFPAATTWAEASKRLTAATKGLSLVVE